MNGLVLNAARQGADAGETAVTEHEIPYDPGALFREQSVVGLKIDTAVDHLLVGNEFYIFLRVNSVSAERFHQIFQAIDSVKNNRFRQTVLNQPVNEFRFPDQPLLLRPAGSILMMQETQLDSKPLRSPARPRNKQRDLVVLFNSANQHNIPIPGSECQGNQTFSALPGILPDLIQTRRPEFPQMKISDKQNRKRIINQ